MDVGLCIVVKDEARQIVDCLKPIHDLFAQTVVVDTGSTDATRTCWPSISGSLCCAEPSTRRVADAFATRATTHWR